MTNVGYGPIVGRLHVHTMCGDEWGELDHIGLPFDGLRDAETAVHTAVRTALAANPRDPHTGLSWLGCLHLMEDRYVGERVVLCHGHVDPDMGRPHIETMVARRYVCYMSHHSPCWLTDHGPQDWPRAVLDWSRGSSHWPASLRVTWIDLCTGRTSPRQVDVTTPTF